MEPRERTAGEGVWGQIAGKVRAPLANLANFLAGDYEGRGHVEVPGQHAATSRALATVLNRYGMLSPAEASMATRAAGVFNEEVPAALQALSGTAGWLGGDENPTGWQRIYGPSGYDEGDLDENERGLEAFSAAGDQRNPYLALGREVASSPINAAVRFGPEVGRLAAEAIRRVAAR